MDWISTLLYGLILQQDRLHRAREPYTRLRVRPAFKWVRTVRQAIALRARRSRRAPGDPRTDRITPAGGPVLPKDEALA